MRRGGRPWYRLHRSTICLLLPAAAVLVLIVVPGDCVEQVSLGGWWGTVLTFEHGWPWVYLKRTD